VFGTGIALGAGGVIVHLVTHAPPVDLPVLGRVRAWQMVFLIVGAPTVLLSPLVFLLRESRTASSQRAARRDEPSGMAFFIQHWRLALWLPLGFAMSTVITSGLGAWTPTYLIRIMGWNSARAGLTYGVIVLCGGLIGQLAGAAIVDWLYARGVRDAHCRYHIATHLITIPLLVLGFATGIPALLFLGLGAFYLITYPFGGYAMAALQLFAPNSARGRASAFYLAVSMVIGQTVGPTGIAWVTDYVLKDEMRLGPAIAIVCGVFSLLAITVLLQGAKAMRSAHATLPTVGADA